MSKEAKRRGPFLSHASEDKWFVKNLADTLTRYGVDSWYDAYEIEPGDSIRAKINEGLRTCDFGVLVLSKAFFKKDWTKVELAALMTMVGTPNVIPVFLDIKPKDLRKYDPALLDVRGIVFDPATNIRSVVVPLVKKVKGVAPVEGDKELHIGETLSVRDLPMTECQTLENYVFEDCVLQGLAVLAVKEDVEFFECHFNSRDVFIPLARTRRTVGTIGLKNVTFRGCRFKDVGFIVNHEMYREMMAMQSLPAGYQLPDHLL